jgi:NADPH2:quinone reductase
MAISVEGGDLLDRSGNFAPLGSSPQVIGRQASGIVESVGEEAAGFSPGQRVVCVRPNGSHAELFAAPARTTWPIPDGLSFEEAAAIPIAFATAHDALHHFGLLSPGEAVLIQAGASGVGLAAIQLARLHGAGRILATGSDDTRLERLRAFGATDLINYRRSDPAGEVVRLTAGQGVNVLLDTVGGASLQASLASMARGGRLVAIGQASRAPLTVDLKPLYDKGIFLSGFKLDIASPRVRDTVREMLQAAASGILRVVIDRTFPLEDAALAHIHVESRRAFGRVVLVP